jgi:hypothetical protein
MLRIAEDYDRFAGFADLLADPSSEAPDGHRQAAGNLVSAHPQSNQISNEDTGSNKCHNKKRPHQPLSKGLLSRHATVRERSFVDRRAVTILDPMHVSFTPLVREISKRPPRIVDCIFDYPSHRILPRSDFALPRNLKHGCEI